MWPLLLLVVGLMAGLAALLASSLTPTATASATLLVQDPRTTSLFGQVSGTSNYVANQVVVLGLRSTAQGAVERLERRVPEARLDAESLQASTALDGDADSDLITVSVTDTRPEVAQAAVTALVDAYRDNLVETAERQRAARLERIEVAIAQVQAELEASRDGPADVLQATRDDLLAQRAQTSAEDLTTGGVEVVSAATLPQATVPYSPLQAAVVGALLGVGLGTGLCYVTASYRRRFTDRFLPEQVTSLPLLTEIPDFGSERVGSDVPALDAPSSAAAEAFRFAATLLAVRRAQAGAPGPVTALVSAASQDGKSTVAANLAVTATQAGRRVLAIDGDLAGRGLTFLLAGDRAGSRGLVDVLEGTCRLEDALLAVELPRGGVLWLLSGGRDSEDAHRVLSTARCAALFDELGDYDDVIVDVPPLLQVAYASSLARAAGTAVLVVPHRSAVRRVEDLLERSQVLELSLLGYLYNKAPLRVELGLQSQLVTDRKRQARKGTVGDLAAVTVRGRDGDTGGGREAVPSRHAPPDLPDELEPAAGSSVLAEPAPDATSAAGDERPAVPEAEEQVPEPAALDDQPQPEPLSALTSVASPSAAFGTGEDPLTAPLPDRPRPLAPADPGRGADRLT
jgi:Mrp family chromosome partitioning ATPase/capsular polysaccharide biosynthesis protein